ncbi:MAG: portal protein, partial [Flavobacteriaceae bacterium]|nr:portal protein [Flavobacteriaceae bacterium]
MADKGLFTRLQRLFSSDVIIRNVGGDQLRVVDTDHIQTSGEFETNSLMDRFAGIYQNPASTSLYGQQFNLNYQYLRTYLYSDYDLMDTDAIVASALDIVADECTLKNDMGEVLQIKSADDDIQQILYNLFYDVLNIEFNLWAWTRQMCKYGDFFLKLEISEKFGVYNVIPYSAYHIERQENFDPEHPSKVIFNYNPEGIYGGSSSGYYTSPNQPAAANTIQFDNYEIAHFRLVSDVNYLPYGRSYIEPGRKLFKQYSLMEDAMLIHRIVRAPEKRIFYINVGSIPPNEVENFMQKTISTMKRTPLMDEKTGEYNLKYNMQNIMEDFYIPVRGNDQATKIDTTKGLDYAAIEDVEYLREKL